MRAAEPRRNELCRVAADLVVNRKVGGHVKASEKAAGVGFVSANKLWKSRKHDSVAVDDTVISFSHGTFNNPRSRRETIWANPTDDKPGNLRWGTPSRVVERAQR